ncbi:MAG: trypsin-like peptidase domain-containing protein [Dehalococcoidia bacterium]|nr:trypsin-like peptidase domain-containing protein [Dehalococcoidia bacterium]
MKWFVGITLTMLLISSVVFGGVLYHDTQGKFAADQQRIAAMSTDFESLLINMSDLQYSLDKLAQNVDGLNSGVAALNSGVAGLSSQVSSLESAAVLLGEDVSSLQSGLTETNKNINSLSDSLGMLQARQDTVADVVALVEPSVVRITCLGLEFFASGSGVIVREDGYVLTNYHVIEDAILISIAMHNGEIALATVAASDADHDLAVLKIISSRTDFPTAALGSSADIKTGDQVIAIGFPYALYPEMADVPSVTMGIISAKRHFDGYDWLQTDTAINSGNSGGPLINMKGEVIGINTLRFVVDDEGYPIDNIGFAIPIDDTKAMIARAVAS